MTAVSFCSLESLELHEAAPVFVKAQVNVALQALHVAQRLTVSVLASLAVRSPLWEMPTVVQADIIDRSLPLSLGR